MRKPHAPSVRSLGLALLLLLGSCGGGATAPPAIVARDLGLLASTLPTTVAASFRNPLAGRATLTLAESEGAFTIDPAALPVAVEAGESVVLGVRFTPRKAGLAQGHLTLQYVDAEQTRLVTHHFQATAETVLFELSPPLLDFGTVELGQKKELEVRVRNASNLSPVTLRSAQATSSAFSVLGSAFPLTLAAGQEGRITLRFQPTLGGPHDGSVDLGAHDPGGPVRIPVLAAGPGDPSETVVDLGLQSFVNGLTPFLQVQVPADAISLTLEGLGAPGDRIGLGEWSGPGGKIYENLALSGDYIWLAGDEIFSTTLPNTDRPNLQLVPGGGLYSFRLRRLNGFGGTVRVRALIETRAGADADRATLDLNVWLASAVPATAATAATDNRLQDILARIDVILDAQGVQLGALHYYDVAETAFDDVTSNEAFAQLLRTTTRATATRLNLFFVRTALGGKVVGVSASIAGPKRNGTQLSGVMSVYGSGLSANSIGLIAAHEIAHFLGLYHTVEQSGDHDFINDTPNCLPNGSDGACATPGGGLLMHWQALGGTDLSAGQGLVIRGHPLLRPRTGTHSKFRPAALTDWDLMELQTLPTGWCGSCSAPAKPALAEPR